MTNAIQTKSLTKRFGGVTALDRLDLAVPEGRVVGLVGRNGSGKTTLFRHVLGLQLPTEGSCLTLCVPTHELGGRELSRIGAVHQESGLLGWMSVRRHLDYVASFHERWDRAREERLLRDLELDPKGRVGRLSPGNLQKLAVILAVCHRPELLLLDEPVSAMDPIAREAFLRFLLELLSEDRLTIVVSSHVLRDVERVVDHVVCLEAGRLVVSAPYEELQERYAEWTVVSRNGGHLPRRFAEPYVVSQEGDGRGARLVVSDPGEGVEEFRARHGAEVTEARLSLERIFPLLVKEARL